MVVCFSRFLGLNSAGVAVIVTLRLTQAGALITTLFTNLPLVTLFSQVGR